MGIRIDKSAVNQLFKDLDKIPPAVHQDAYHFMKRKTPVQSGNARSNTRKESNGVIASRYPYAERLDTGWSKQAPKGFTDPTTAEIDQLVDKEIRKL